MSIFSSLNYLLKRAYSIIHQIASKEPPLNMLLKESTFTTKASLLENSENGYLQSTLDTDNFSNQSELYKSIDTSILEQWISFITRPTSKSRPQLLTNITFTSESEVQLSNETFPDANHLLESWWNVFDERYLRHGLGWTITLIIAYMSILVAGVIGNVMVVLVVLLRPQMRTVTNMFITNLAVADLFVIVFCVPSTLLANIFSRKP